MMKKLFLFTLLVSSFLVISCSNKDTTGPTTPVISSAWYGTYKYSGTTETGVPVESTITVSENGISIYETENGGEPIAGDYPNSQLKKVSENVYQTEELSGPSYVKLEFASTATGATLTVTDYVDGQASAPVVHTKISTVIDSKWYGTYKYSEIINTGALYELTVTVDDKGISSVETEDGDITGSGGIENNQLIKVSESVYKTPEDADHLYNEFEFSSTASGDTILTIIDCENGQPVNKTVLNR